MSLTASLCLWFSVILSLGGFGLTLRAVEARFGRLSLTGFHGLYEHSPTLAVCFLLTGLASVGFPGTLGFISTELLVDSAVEVNPTVGIVVVAAAALNGIAVVRAYLHLFTGARHVSTVWLGIGDARADRGADPRGDDPRRRPVPAARRHDARAGRRGDPGGGARDVWASRKPPPRRPRPSRRPGTRRPPPPRRSHRQGRDPPPWSIRLSTTDRGGRHRPPSPLPAAIR